MTKTTQKDLKQYVALNLAENVTNFSFNDCVALRERESGFDKISYSCGIYGINGILVQGHTSGNFYVSIGRTASTMILS